MDHKREHRTPPPPLARVMRVGRQHVTMNHPDIIMCSHFMALVVIVTARNSLFLYVIVTFLYFDLYIM